MKTSFTVLAALLASIPATASLVARDISNGLIDGDPPSRRWATPSVCNADNVLRALRNPTRSVSASSFCSTFLQPTAVVTSTVLVPETQVLTAFSTSTTFTTTTNTVTLTSPTATCAAAPTTAITCGEEGYGYLTYLISQTTSTDHVTCHEMCLANPNCQSFETQTGGALYCNLFNTVTSGSALASPGSGFFFYDRDCPDYLPAGCPSNALPPRAVAARSVSIPTYLATVPADRISSACSCFITSADATATSTALATSTVSTTTTSTDIVPATQVQTSEATAFVTSYVIAAA